MAAVRHGDYIAKVRVAAAAQNAEKVIHPQLDLNSGPDVFGPVLADELKAHAFDFDLQVQLCADLMAMPVNDTTREWPEKLSPFVTVGRVHIPRQDIPDPENFDKGDALAFNQWRVTSDHRPLGEIMDVRRVYSASAKVRRTLNHQPQRERPALGRLHLRSPRRGSRSEFAVLGGAFRRCAARVMQAPGGAGAVGGS